ncbi:MAG: hypothetical protein ACRDCE_05925 [Cetobacterium sp.]|uniref:hypothetical protein n=1 Tax=Cetobacterium sp. TaxID=2071632 RepID=UPI003EE74513
MEVELIRTGGKTRFNDLKSGEIFYYEGSHYVRTSGNNPLRAMHIPSGRLTDFSSDCSVLKSKAKFVVEVPI